MRFAGIILALVLNLSLCLLVQSDGTISTSRAPRGRPNQTTKRAQVKRIRATGRPLRAKLDAPQQAGYDFEPAETCGLRPGLAESKKDDPDDERQEDKSRRRSRGKSASKGPHISGGELARPGEFPSFVLIRMGDHVSEVEQWEDRYCGGVLVGPQLIMTAAHCVERAYTKVILVTLGLNSPNQVEKNEWEAHVFCFPKMACPLHEDYVLDFALLKLKRPIKYTNFTQPACIRTKPLDMSGSKFLYQLVGRGANQDDHISTDLMKASFARGCPYTWQPEFLWTQKTVMCYLPRNGSQPCLYDSGDPMYMMSAGKQYVTGMALFSASQECEVREQKPSYFIDMVRLGPGLYDTISSCVISSQVPRQYHEKKCFEVKPKAPPNEINIMSDSQLANSTDDWSKEPAPLDEYLEDDVMDFGEFEPLETCGKKPISSSNSLQLEQRLIKDSEFPSFVVVGYPKAEGLQEYLKNIRCEGALIGPRLIVTSATCISEANVAELEVLLGASNYEPETKSAPVSEVCVSKKWCIKHEALRNLAFIKLKDPVIYSQSVQPACFAPHLRTDSRLLRPMEFVTLINGTPWEDRSKWSGRNVAVISIKAGSFNNHPQPKNWWDWFNSTGTGYQSRSPCKPDAGAPLYARHPGLGYRETVVGISNALFIHLAPECTFTRQYTYNDYRNGISPTFFTDIYKMRHEIKDILSNCMRARSFSSTSGCLTITSVGSGLRVYYENASIGEEIVKY